MEVNEKKNLVIILTNKMQKAKESAYWADKKDKKSQLVLRSDDKINPKYISNEQYFQIAQLYNFLKENEDLSKKEIEEVLKVRFFKFAFLRKLNRIIPDFIEELKFHGVRTMAMTYANIKYQKDLIKEHLS